MAHFFQTKPKNKEEIKSCYFFYGEEVFFAYEYIESLKQILFNTKEEESNVEKFLLGEHTWIDVIDTARTVPLLFSQNRIIIAEYSKSKSGAQSGKRRALSNIDKELIQEYLQAPAAGTTLIVIFPDKVKKDNSLIKFFSGLSSGNVCVAEMRSFWDSELLLWLDAKAAAEGKTISPDAKRRLVELIGNAPALLAKELEKILIYIDKKSKVEIGDVEQVTMALKVYSEWEISDSLARADFAASVRILDELINKESISPAYILGVIAKFFRDILMAKLGLEQKKADRKAIFKELYPNIPERFRQLYDRKFRELFSLVDYLSWEQLNSILGALREVDLKMKTTGESPQILLEGFLFESCRLMKIRSKNVILKGWD